MRIEYNYRENENLRRSFNELAEKVFGLNFENWYKNGFWKDNYIPYSVIEDGKVVSNVSVNACSMKYDGRIVKLIQLGTIMTDPDYRGRGYSGVLMERVILDYKDKVDGIYLFANDSVLDFYPKFGFTIGKEYQYSKDVDNNCETQAVLVPMTKKEDWDKMVRIITEKEQNSRFYMVENTGLYMFYLSQFMQKNTFYVEKCDSYAVAEVEDDTLILHTIFGKGDVDEVISAFGNKIKKVVLNYTPKNTNGFVENELHEEDTTLFVMGKFFEEIKDDKLMFQAITHA